MENILTFRRVRSKRSYYDIMSYVMEFLESAAADASLFERIR